MRRWGIGDPGLGWAWKMLLQAQAPRAGEAGPLGTTAKAGLGSDGAGGPARGDACPPRDGSFCETVEAAAGD